MSKLVVTNHALDQFRSRRIARGEGDMRDGLLREMIREQVQKAFASGMISNHKPEGFHLYGERRRQLPDGQFFARAHAEYGYIVKRTEGEGDIVVTMISRVGVRR